MPKTPARDDYFAQSFRFTPEQTAVIKEEAKRLGSRLRLYASSSTTTEPCSDCQAFRSKCSLDDCKKHPNWEYLQQRGFSEFIDQERLQEIKPA